MSDLIILRQYEQKCLELAELRQDLGRFQVFAREFLDPEGYGHAVNSEIRNHARRLLGMKERE
jgi:hypothetical protein